MPEGYDHANSFVGNVGPDWAMFDICEGTDTGIVPIDIGQELREEIILFMEEKFTLEGHYFVTIKKTNDTTFYYNHNSEKCLYSQKEHQDASKSITITSKAITYCCNSSDCEGRLAPVKIFIDEYPPS